MKKRLTSLLIVLCLVLALVPTAMAVSAADFTDVKEGTWYYDYVNEVVSKGYFKGESSTIFSPDKQMTRAMFVTVLSRVDGATVNDSKSTFDDVPVDQWYTGAVTWANENKIVLGTGGKNFEPERAIPRIDMCLIMSRYISYYAAKTGRVPVTTSSGKTFSDVSGLDAEAKAALDRCVAYGLIEGTPEGTFKPYDTATRAEVAAVISRLAWTTTGGGGIAPRVNSITYYRNYNNQDTYNTTRTGTGTLHVLDGESLFGARDGYTFVGWNEDPNGNGKVYEVGASVTGEVTLYAQWKEKPVDADHINEAVGEAVNYVNTEANSLYDRAFKEIENLLTGTTALADVKAFKDDTTFSVVLNGQTISVSFNTNLNSDNENLRALLQFAVDYAKEVYGSDTSKQDVKDLAANIKNRLKEMLDRMEIEYSGDTMAQKLDTAARNLAELGKGKAAEYRDDMKEIFKNVDTKNLEEAVSNGATSILGVTISANGNELLTVDKDMTPTRADLEAAAQKAHEVVQTVSETEFSGEYKSIDEIAKKITGKVVFEPADAIKQNYKAAGGDYDAEYTVTFTVTTGTGSYLQYKYDGKNDHFLFAPTQAMWNKYVKSLDGIRGRVVNRLKNNPGTPAAANVPAPFAANTAMFIGFAAPIAGVPVPTSAEDGGQMTLVELIHLLDDMFKQVTDNEEDDHVDKAIDKWKDANKDNFTKEEMVDILIGEKSLDTEGLDNSAIDELVDQLVTEAVGKAQDEIKGHKAYDYDRVSDLLDTKGGAQEFLGSSADSFFEADGTTPKAGYEGIVDHLFNSMADKINDQRAEEITDPAEQAKAAAVKEKAEDKTELNTFVDNSIKEQMNNTEQIFEFAGELGYTEEIEKEIKDKFGDNVNIDDVKKALKLFDDAKNPDELVKKTLGGAVDSMKSEVISNLAKDRWANYSARVERVLTRANNALNRVLNSRFGDTAESATIQIGTNGNKVDVDALRAILTDDYDTYDLLVEALGTFVNETANISDLSIESLATTPITVEAGKYSYTFYVEISFDNIVA